MTRRTRLGGFVNHNLRRLINPVLVDTPDGVFIELRRAPGCWAVLLGRIRAAVLWAGVFLTGFIFGWLVGVFYAL